MGKNTEIGVGVVGCGAIAQVMHLPYLEEIPEFRVSALCDVSASQVAAVGARHHVPPNRQYADFRDLAACPGVDAVLVLSAGSHAPAAIAAARAGKHVFVEKPMCLAPREADEMIAAAETAGVQLMVGYMKAYDPTYQTARELWREMREADEIRFIRVHDICHDNAHVIADLYGSAIVHSQDDIALEVRAQLAAQSQALLDEALGADASSAARRAYGKFLGLLTHDTSILMLAFGEPSRVLSAEVWDDGQGLVTILEFGEKVRCVLETSRGGQHWMDESLAVYGALRQATLEFPSPYHRNAATVLRVRENAGPGYSERQVVSSLAEAFKRELEHFRDCIFTGKKPLTDGLLGKRNVELGQEVVKLAQGAKKK
ncbi:MAG: Gfo/Idh/MocA family oxidoreductase [Chloroflexi bacterium]|nr:Gfo/Idh/MocA family oxidoreductase [Chloroflexota bacterium]